MRLAKYFVIGVGLVVTLARVNAAHATDINSPPGDPLNLNIQRHFDVPSVPAGSSSTYDMYLTLTAGAVSSFASATPDELAGTITATNLELYSCSDASCTSVTLITDLDGAANKIKTAGIAAGTYDIRLFVTASSDAEGSVGVNFKALPIPAAAWLLLSGVAGLGALSRRRRAVPEPA
jgi:hypothetical protein